jgi:hypothetical protein
MSISLQQLIDESILQAKRGLDPNAVIDPLVAESLLPTVFQQVGIDCAKDERKRSLLRREKTITFSGGTATVTSDVFTQYAEDSLLYDPDDTSTEYSLCRNWSDFVRSGDSLLGRYSFNGSTIGILEPNEVYDPTSGTSARIERLLSLVRRRFLRARRLR